ncbi:hypothetical protein PG993_003214 [Apiospora rasikravindrae]|uniref:Uncharacterized protein n=1 Tax=Apiospora rasikravindrae TaxID=990691 RepID=A0ABR1U1M5_9PEZI
MSAGGRAGTILAETFGWLLWNNNNNNNIAVRSARLPAFRQSFVQSFKLNLALQSGSSSKWGAMRADKRAGRGLLAGD